MSHHESFIGILADKIRSLTAYHGPTQDSVERLVGSQRTSPENNLKLLKSRLGRVALGEADPEAVRKLLDTVALAPKDQPEDETRFISNLRTVHEGSVIIGADDMHHQGNVVYPNNGLFVVQSMNASNRVKILSVGVEKDPKSKKGTTLTITEIDNLLSDNPKLLSRFEHPISGRKIEKINVGPYAGDFVKIAPRGVYPTPLTTFFDESIANLTAPESGMLTPAQAAEFRFLARAIEVSRDL